MKAKEIKYARTYNVGPFEKEEFEISAVMEDDDDKNAAQALIELKDMVALAYSSGPTVASVMASVTDVGDAKNDVEPVTEVAEPITKKPRKGKKQKEEEIVEEAAAKVENENEEAVDTAVAEEEEEAEEEEAEEVRPTKPAKKFRKKNELYDRENAIHKKIFTKQVSTMMPNWRETQKAKDKVKAVSLDLEGEEFLGADGKILPEFVAMMKKKGLK